MLTKILANYSQNELLSFIPQDAINFDLAIDSDRNQLNESVNHYNKQKLALLVASAKKVKFLFEEPLRIQLIERLSPHLFIGLFLGFKNSHTQVKAEYYDAAITWSEKNPHIFASRFDLNALYVGQINQKKPF
jgi:DNA repair protein RadD